MNSSTIHRPSPRGSAAALPSTSARSSSNSVVIRSVAPKRPMSQTPLAAKQQPRRQSKISAIENDTVLSAAAASADATAQIYDVNDPVVTAAFSLATAALTILTLGVAYLSITGWIDSRNEEAERKRVEAAERSRAMNPSQGSVPRRKKKATDVLTSRGGGKGFSK